VAAESRTAQRGRCLHIEVLLISSSGGSGVTWDKLTTKSNISHKAGQSGFLKPESITMNCGKGVIRRLLSAM
jgi:hypothetical protein